jgi:hypothetical protein
MLDKTKLNQGFTAINKYADIRNKLKKTTMDVLSIIS